MKRSSYYLFHVIILLPESLSKSFKIVENRGIEWPKKCKKSVMGSYFTIHPLKGGEKVYRFLSKTLDKKYIYHFGFKIVFEYQFPI